MQEVQTNTFYGGLDRDSDYRVIPNDRYVEALNVDIYSIDRNSNKAISPLHSSELKFTIPNVASQLQYTKLYWEVNKDIEIGRAHV